MFGCFEPLLRALHHVRNHFLHFSLTFSCLLSEIKTSTVVLKWTDHVGCSFEFVNCFFVLQKITDEVKMGRENTL